MRAGASRKRAGPLRRYEGNHRVVSGLSIANLAGEKLNYARFLGQFAVWPALFPKQPWVHGGGGVYAGVGDCGEYDGVQLGGRIVAASVSGGERRRAVGGARNRNHGCAKWRESDFVCGLSRLSRGVEIAGRAGGTPGRRVQPGRSRRYGGGLGRNGLRELF